ncbi:hypothetical protein [Croceibacterium aestuarii]|uniref:hypothetical protein n=1 Tax=Croceibacterium aestuarii TaxID=3064139 RepID=UPI00272EA015|nr:hypothetical protein [Croceibacterium sp. D39]
MTKIYQFPMFRVESQLFHVPGAGYDGGLTAGGAQFITPEPGGFGVLEIMPAIIDTEWIDPAASWLMSKIDGQVMRVRLAASPQIAWSLKRNNQLDWDWVNPVGPRTEAVSTFTATALKGETAVAVDISELGRLLRPGHVIGHAFDCYLVDEIEYAGSVANIVVKPPLRRDIAVNDECLFTPWFTGRISNGADIRAAYNNLGHVKPGNIVLHEAVL